MVRTRVGFSDGAEVVQVDFDPESISYQALLDVFWRSHNPVGSNRSRLYQKGVFVHNDAQDRIAKKSLATQQSSSGSKITSTIEPANFRLASSSDQKYYLRHDPSLWSEFQKQYSKDSDIVDSPAAAKVNGYLAGNSNRKQFEAYSESLGLSPQSLARLRDRVPTKAHHWVPHCKLPALK